MNKHTGSILIVDDEPDMIRGLRRILQLDGYHVDDTENAAGLFARHNWSDYLAIILDRKLPDAMADEFLPKLKQLAPDASIIIITGYADLDSAIAALRQGAADYLTKPVNPAALRASLARASERQKTLAALRKSEERLSMAVRATNDAIWDCDLVAGTTWWNETYNELFGERPPETADSWQWWVDHIHPDDRQRVHESLRAFGQGTGGDDRWIEHYRYQRTDGSYAHVIDRALRARDAAGKPVRILGAMFDITELREAQERLLQAERLSAIGAAMAGLVHESRNALNVTQSSLRMIERRTKQLPEFKPILDGAREAQQEIQRLFEEVRQYAAPLVVQHQPCNLVELVETTWKKLAPIREGRTARLVQHHEHIQPECDACHNTLGRAFRNILENALTACADPLRIDVHYRAATLHGKPAIRVTVSDNGPGLTPEQRKRIFDAFYTTKTHGTGLGMAISQRIVEAHGGSIAVGNRNSDGAEFLLTLPVKKS